MVVRNENPYNIIIIIISSGKAPAILNCITTMPEYDRHSNSN